MVLKPKTVDRVILAIAIATLAVAVSVGMLFLQRVG